MQFELNLTPRPPFQAEQLLSLGTRQIPLALKHNPRARRYILRLDRDGRAQVTVPRRGSAIGARRFAESNKGWLEKQFQRRAAAPPPQRWEVGSEILFRGAMVKIETDPAAANGTVRFGTERIHVKEVNSDLRGPIQRQLWTLAVKELPSQVRQLAQQHQLQVHRISVRNQKSRWGSCSRKGTISLNWRLVQAPDSVRDYIILHELMHLRQMNHSTRFWREVEKVCPDYRAAERWLKQNAGLLR